MRHRPSKFLIIPILALLAGLGLILPVLSNFGKSRPGEIVFRTEKPAPFRPAPPASWFEEKLAALKKWEHYPLKPKSENFGSHYFGLLESSDPVDQARARALQQRAQIFYEQLLIRYPELAVPLKVIPNERNGFLKLLEFSESRKDSVDPIRNFELPQTLEDYFDDTTKWNTVEAAAFLTREKSTIDEIRAIGLMPESSSNGIAVDRWWQIPGQLTQNCAKALMLHARLAAEEGDIATALESIRAAKGLVDHLTHLETPTLLGAIVHIGIQRRLEDFVLTEVLPSLPAGQIDPAAWENVLRPTVHPPAEFARIMKGEWSVGVRIFLLPVLLDDDDPHPLPDPGALLDAHAAPFREIVRVFQSAKSTDWPTLPLPPPGDLSQLSKTSQVMAKAFQIHSASLRDGWKHAQSESGLTQAAFAILKGHPLPKDPIYGQDYSWDPATRELSILDFDPIIVPKP
jgi:hypothetical protein